MKKLWRILIAILLIAVLCGVACLLPRRPAQPVGPEPMYKGRSVRDWVSEIWSGNEAENPQIKEFPAIGAPAVPYIIKRLEDPRPFYARNQAYAKLWQSAPSWLQRRLPDPRRPNPQERDQSNGALVMVLARLGPQAEAAVPILTRIVDDKNVGGPTRVVAISALQRIGSPAKSALPVLMARLRDDHLRGRRQYFALHGPNYDATADNWDWLQRGQAALAVAGLDPANPRAIEPIRLLLNASNSTTRAYSAVALWRLEPGAEIQRTVEAHLHDPDLRFMTVIALGQIGKPAGPLLPLLRKLREETNPANTFWESLGHALKNIDSNAPEQTSLNSTRLAP